MGDAADPWPSMSASEQDGPGPPKSCRQAVILSAGLGTRIAIVAGGRPKAILTAGTSPVIISQLRQLYRCGVRRAVVVHARGDDRHLRPLVDGVFSRAGMEFRFVEQEPPTGPLDAFACGAEHLMPSTGGVILVLGDTLVANMEALPLDAVGVGPVNEAREFCVVAIDHLGRIIGYEDKPDRDDHSDYAVVGVYRLADADLVRSLLRESSTFVTGELSDLLRRYGRHRPLQAVPMACWRDLGSYDRYVLANRSALLGRADHTFVVGDDGFVVKSGECSLMTAQARWYRNLPDSAIGLAPRMVESGEGWYRVELLDYPSLAQLLLYEVIPQRTWRFVLSQLLEVIEVRLWAPTRREDASLPAWCERKYITKTEQRLTRWPAWSNLRAQRVVVNDIEVSAFDDLWSSAVTALRDLAASAIQSCLIHGDMTFSNILLLRGYGLFKMLDPGTTFSEAQGGDPRYDLAKLRQSYAGGYDALREDLFHLHRCGPQSWQLQVFPQPSPIAAVGDEVLIAAGYDPSEIRLLEAVQFLSMVPLHHDNPDRQFALYACGLHLLTAVLEGRSHALTLI
jgi:dTDP-glucose pyrophosphorylase